MSLPVRVVAFLAQLFVLLAVLFGCSQRDHGTSGAAGVKTAAVAATISSAEASWANAQNSNAVAHDPAHPPIDCPLHKQGVHTDHLKPFEDTEKYITFLERADRALWQKPDEVVAALSLKGSETVVDLGAGSGYFAFRFAKALPKGKVIAADTEAEMVRHLHHKAMSERVSNLEARIIQSNAPAVPSDADLVFICDVLHHVSERAAWLSHVSVALKPGAKLALIEFKDGKLPEGPPEGMKIPRAELLSLMTHAGFVLDGEHPELLPYQVFMVFKKR